jgi:hypothetical protein
MTVNPNVVNMPILEKKCACLDGCRKGFMAGCRLAGELWSWMDISKGSCG